jgi:two-component system response regulator GlrR
MNPGFDVSSRKAHILLVDDDASLVRLLTIRLESEGYKISTASSGAEALQKLRAHAADLLLTDLRMDDMDGMGLFREVQKLNPSLPVIIMTAHGTIPDAVQAAQQGVFGFITKPLEKEQLLDTISSALQTSQQQGNDDWSNSFITNNSQMLQLLQQAKMAAQSNVSILIQGESGTGKEVLARAIHRASTRVDKPFVTINCGALPEQLLESELFGHTKGSFTGAIRNYPGLFRAADGGTLFLDEIGDMPVPLQVKLLRALQEKTIRPLGSIQDVHVDVRIISATHQNLEEGMKEGLFRQDLYYRLNVVNFQLPTLAQRSEDIPALVQYLLSKRQDIRDGFVKGFAPEALAMLCEAKWPGNIRQLVNVIEQTIALTSTPIISPALVQQALANQVAELPTFNEARAHFERNYLTKVMTLTEGSVSQASRMAGRNRTDFYKLLNKHHMEPSAFKKGDASLADD